MLRIVAIRAGNVFSASGRTEKYFLLERPERVSGDPTTSPLLSRPSLRFRARANLGGSVNTSSTFPYRLWPAQILAFPLSGLGIMLGS